VEGGGLERLDFGVDQGHSVSFTGWVVEQTS
jgi:hypothetical protein